MQIKRLTADKKYKETYFEIIGNVYKLNHALEYFCENKEAILKQNESFKPAKTPDLVFKALPSDEVLLQKIKQKRLEIYKQLGITKENKKAPQNIKKLAFYLMNNIRYYEPIKEEVKNTFNNMYQTEFERMEKKLTSAEQKYEQAATEWQKDKSNMELLHKKQVYENIYDKQINRFYSYCLAQKDELIRSNTKYALQSIYKALLENRGVCSDFSLTYSYLLSGIGVKSKILHINYDTKWGTKQHAINLVEETNDKHYFFDILEGYYNQFFTNDVESNLQESYITREMFFNKEQYNLKYKDAQLRYFEEILEKPKFKITYNFTKKHMDKLFDKTESSTEHLL